MEMELGLESSSDYLNPANHYRHQDQDEQQGYQQPSYPWLLQSTAPTASSGNTESSKDSSRPFFNLNTEQDQTGEGHGYAGHHSSHPSLSAAPQHSTSATPFGAVATNHAATSSSPFLSDSHATSFYPLSLDGDEDDDSGSGGMIRPTSMRRSLANGLDRGDIKRRRIHETSQLPPTMSLGSSVDHRSAVEADQPRVIDDDADVAGWLNPSPETQPSHLDREPVQDNDSSHSYHESIGGMDLRSFPGSRSIVSDRDRDDQVEAILDLGLELPQGDDQASSSGMMSSNFQHQHQSSPPNERLSVEQDHTGSSFGSLDSHSLLHSQLPSSLQQPQQLQGRTRKEKRKKTKSHTEGPVSPSLEMEDFQQRSDSKREPSSKGLTTFRQDDKQSSRFHQGPFDQSASNQDLSWNGSFSQPSAVRQDQGSGIASENNDEPLYVNAKQYQRIMARRNYRAEKESTRQHLWSKMWRDKIKEICNGNPQGSPQMASSSSKGRSKRKGLQVEDEGSEDGEEEESESDGEEGLEDLGFDQEEILNALRIAMDQGWENWSPHRPIGKEKVSKSQKDGVVMEERIGEDGKPYLYESRHAHAMRRPRGKGGRFLTAQEIEELRSKEEGQGSA